MNNKNDNMKAHRLKAWKAKKLALIEKHLKNEAKRNYDKLRNELNTSSIKASGHIASWVGPTSPLNLDELNNMTTAAILDYLENWKPPRGHREPSAEGLARFLREIAKQRAEEFSNTIHSIEEHPIRPVYYYYIFDGISNSIQQLGRPEWESILSLMLSIIESESLPTFPEFEDEFETKWDGAQKEMARLLEAGLKDPEYSIPFEFKEQVWKIIEALVKNPDPDIEYEQNYGPPNTDPMTCSINTTRGCAVHAAFFYSLWIDHYINLGKEKENQHHVIPNEAKYIFEKLLEPKIEPTITIRSVFGWRLITLAYLEKDWLSNNISRIFPSQKEYCHLKNAAIEGFFAFNHPNGSLFRDFRVVYELGLKWVLENPEDYSFAEPKKKFAQHLMVCYWWGLDDIKQVDSLVRQFFLVADISLKSEAISFIGRNLERFIPALPDIETMLKRIVELYSWRLEMASLSENKDQFVLELMEFGWWFAKAQIEKEWLLSTLIKTLKITNGKLECYYDVIKRLIDFIEVDSASVAKVIYEIAKGEPEKYNLVYWSDDLRNILKRLLDLHDENTNELATKAIDKLCERGLTNFKNLL